MSAVSNQMSNDIHFRNYRRACLRGCLALTAVVAVVGAAAVLLSRSLYPGRIFDGCDVG